MVYEIILQAYGWEKGWRIITGLGANVRSFTNSASQVPKDVAIGEVAYGLAIDFYAWAQVNEAGADKIGFVMPDNLTIIGPDGIAILKGAPNPSVAEAFVRFVMSPAGQKLWLWVKEAADGPQRFQLNRFSVLPSLYGLSPEHTAVKLNPFSWRSDFAFDEKLCVRPVDRQRSDRHHGDRPKGSSYPSLANSLGGGLTEEEWQRLGAMPISETEALDLATTKWKDPAFRNQKLNEWSQFAREKYRKNIKPPMVRPEWLSLFALGLLRSVWLCTAAIKAEREFRSMVSVQFERVTKILGQSRAVDGLTLEITARRTVLSPRAIRMRQNDGAAFGRGLLYSGRRQNHF